jgi:hypothetical protein
MTKSWRKAKRKATRLGTSRGDDRVVIGLRFKLFGTPASRVVLLTPTRFLLAEATACAGPYNSHTIVLTTTPKSLGLDSDLVPLLLFIVVASALSQSAMTRESRPFKFT